MKFLTWWEFTKLFISTLWEIRPEIFKKTWWISDFPDYYHPKCFDCNLGLESCSGCEHYILKENIR